MEIIKELTTTLKRGAENNRFSPRLFWMWLWNEEAKRWKEECRSYLNLNDEPLEKRTGLGFGLGSSKSLKKAWCSTHIFQKDLQKSRLAIRNSKVSWNELWKLRWHLWCKQTSNICYKDPLIKHALCYRKKSFSQLIVFSGLTGPLPHLRHYWSVLEYQNYYSNFLLLIIMTEIKQWS